MRSKVIVILFSLVAICGYGQEAFLKKEFKHKDGHVLPYRMLAPENAKAKKKYPLILFLHGAGERGNDNEKQLTHGSSLFLDSVNREKYPAYVVMPQCPEDSYWANLDVDTTTSPRTLRFDYSKNALWPLQAALELTAELIEKENVDPERVYVMGLSMGGMGTFEAVYRKPQMFAAALPICGGGDTKMYDQRVRPVRFWVFHGAVDEVVDVKLSRDMVKRLKDLDVDVQYTEYPNVNHNSWDNVFAEPDLLPWIFKNKRKK